MTDDMNKPVTRRELEASLADKLAPYATKKDLEAWGHRLIEYLNEQLNEQLARHFKGALVEMRGMLGIVDEKYNAVPGRVATLETLPARVGKLETLPARVEKLEAAVFPRKRQRRR
jgi:hypothetical protein